eukprot:Skav228487  [mRNA]  locus=scaffold1092:195788:198135:- [translate_table: standard]
MSLVERDFLKQADVEIVFANNIATCHLCAFESCTRVERSDAEIHRLLFLPRAAAQLMTAPLLRALLDAKVSFRTQRVAATSVARFQIRIATTVPAPTGALIIQGPSVSCSFFRVLGTPRLQLRAADDLLPGLYSFELPVQNPAPWQLLYTSWSGLPR